MIYLRLAWEFFKTGLFSVGGGLATLPFLYDLSDKTGWFSHADLANMLAISESTPGAIGINMATYVGFEKRHLFPERSLRHWDSSCRGSSSFSSSQRSWRNSGKAGTSSGRFTD